MASDSHAHDVDHVTGTATTGHSWDGIKELNTPLPRWWLWTFYLTIIWAIGYWIVYPAWPLISSHTKGMFGYSSRVEVRNELAALDARRGALAQGLVNASVEEIKANPELLRIALARGKAAFGDNCAACHGQGGSGALGYPNLTDDDWLWGGKLADIQQTINHGVRWSQNAETRPARCSPSAGPACSRSPRSPRWSSTSAPWRASTSPRPPIPPRARSSTPRTAPPATATPARACRSSALPT